MGSPPQGCPCSYGQLLGSLPPRPCLGSPRGLPNTLTGSHLLHSRAPLYSPHSKDLPRAGTHPITTASLSERPWLPLPLGNDGICPGGPQEPVFCPSVSPDPPSHPALPCPTQASFSLPQGLSTCSLSLEGPPTPCMSVIWSSPPPRSQPWPPTHGPQAFFPPHCGHSVKLKP